MTPADRRISELIDKWLASIDLHLKYVELSDAAYARAQAWPKHDRPTRWVLEVARQKVLELKSHVENRQAMGDGKFSESLELMAFLANLVGIQHIQRFIPLADAASAGSSSSASQTLEAPTVANRARRAPARQSTRRPGRCRASNPRRRQELLHPVEPKPRIEAVRPPARAAAAGRLSRVHLPRRALTPDLKGKIIADAIRLLKWGKSWHELAELIARIADRPSAAEIRKVLRTHKAEIEEKAAAG